MAESRTRIREGLPHPLGATWDGLGVNFALFSAHATKVELCLFDATGRREVERIEMPEYTDEVWHGYLRDLPAGAGSGYRVHRPYQPGARHPFHAHKLLLRPHAQGPPGKLAWGTGNFRYPPPPPDPGRSLCYRDSA